jgi:dCTP deaminase
MLKNDQWISDQAALGMITPFVPESVREIEYCEPGHMGVWQRRKVLSYGCSSYGYDLRLSPSDFRVFRHVPGTVVNPKRFTDRNLETVALESDADGDYFIIPAHSYALGVALERLQIPPNITVICLGKSTMARCGIIANVTPAEAGWQGHLTLEFSNASNADCRIYAGEGIIQLLFLEGEPCNTTYADRLGKYQDQGERVVFAKA